MRSVALHELPLVHHHDLVVHHHGVQSVGDGEDGAGGEAGLDSSLYEMICPQVEAGRGLVQQEDLVPPDQSPGQADQLFLPHREIISVRLHHQVQPPGVGLHLVLQVALLHHPPELLIAGLAEGVDVVPETGLEQHRVLGDHGQAGPEVGQSQGAARRGEVSYSER